MFIITCSTVFIFISIGHADQNEDSKADILEVLSQMSRKIDSLDSKVDKFQEAWSQQVDNFQESISQLNNKVYNIQEEMSNMKVLFSSNGLLANEVNQKISLLPTMILDMSARLGKSLIDSVGNDLNEQEKILSNIDTNISSLENTCNNINTNISHVKSDIKAHIDTSKCSDQVLSKTNGGDTTLQHNITEVDSKLSEILCRMPFKNCADLYKNGCKTSEPVQIFPRSWSLHDSVSVVCDEDWTIIQRRQDVQPRVNFYRTWADYVQGFGKLKEEFWLGLDYINKITSATRYELYIELEDWEANTRWAKYSHFEVGPAEDNYRLTVTGYSGDAGDALEYHNGQAFSTFDQDNDASSSGNCAQSWKGAWWYKSCHHANLNGLPDRGTDGIKGEGINWAQWRTINYSLRAVTMKIRPQVN